MAASVLDIKRLRRMINELDDTYYKDDDLASYLESWPLVDKNGKTVDDEENWIEAYDLHAAAADLWEEKAARFQEKYNFSADGSSYSANQMYENAIKMAKHHRASQKALVKKMPRSRLVDTYFPEYTNPVFDEDEPPDWIDMI